ncbi:MAG: family 43 glycosylhydrolase [Rikenellaceae bacterium]
MNKIYKIVTLFIVALGCSCAGVATAPKSEASNDEYQGAAFPYTVTETTADRDNLSESTRRVLTTYMGYRPEENPLFTNFKYTPLEGLEYPDDGTLTRRDPSKIIKVGDTFYMWYTRRETHCAPLGAANAAKCDDVTPSTDWDLAEIWYATSKDGFVWKEQGVAVERPKRPMAGFRSVSTPDILVWKGKYYLYYQAFSEPSGLKGDYCPVSMSYASSPDGPWTHHEGEVIKCGEKGAWNQFAIHDPYPLVHNGRIYIYYKSAFNRPDRLWVGQGLATADSPEGPFTHYENNPVLASGHEVVTFPFKEGVAAILTTDGLERNTIQYASDWVNFKIASVVELPPVAAAPYCPDAFTNTKNGWGIEWGVCHFIGVGGKQNGKRHSEIVRFDCSLTQDLSEKSFKTTRPHPTPDVFLKNKLTKSIKDKRIKEAKK